MHVCNMYVIHTEPIQIGVLYRARPLIIRTISRLANGAGLVVVVADNSDEILKIARRAMAISTNSLISTNLAGDFARPTVDGTKEYAQLTVNTVHVVAEWPGSRFFGGARRNKNCKLKIRETFEPFSVQRAIR